MMSLKKISLLLLLMTLTGASQGIAAVDDRKVDPTAEEMAADLKQKFELSEAQEKELIPVFKYHLKKRKELYLRETRGANKKKLRQEVRALRQEVEARIAKIVTPEQMKKWQDANPPVPVKRPGH